MEYGSERFHPISDTLVRDYVFSDPDIPQFSVRHVSTWAHGLGLTTLHSRMFSINAIFRRPRIWTDSLERHLKIGA
jgi:hypothetical protein